MTLHTSTTEIVIALLLLVLVIGFMNKDRSFNYRYKKRKEYIGKSLTEIDFMSGKEFEGYLEALFHKNGYKSVVTKGSHDFGADLVMKSSRKKIVIQAKRYKGNVGVKAVMEIYAAQAYYKADEAYVFTNSTYTKGARELAKATGVILCERKDIINLRNKVR